MLPVVCPFNSPYEAWVKRNATYEEMLAALQAGGPRSLTVNTELLARITNEYEAVEYMAKHVVDGGLEQHINEVLAEDPAFQTWLQAMPGVTPAALDNYRHRYPLSDFSEVDLAINSHGAILSPGQVLVHGGDIAFPTSNRLVTIRPLSTTFCPQVALRESEWSGKAYNAGKVCLYLLHVRTPNIKVFVFDPKDLDKGNEKEVLLGSGAELRLESSHMLRDDYTVWRANGSTMESKRVPLFLCEIGVF